MEEQSIMNLIPLGKKNAIHLQELSEKSGVSPENTKRLIRAARKTNPRLLSGRCGYWIAEDDNEVMAFLKMMQKQAVSRFVTCKAIKESIDNTKGQISMYDYDSMIEDEMINNVE